LPTLPSFTRDIFPVLERLSAHQWVNQGFFVLFGQNSPSDFSAPENIARLSDRSEQHRALREAVFRWFRNPERPHGAPQEPEKLPPFYGDTFGDFTNAFDNDLSVTRTQYRFLRQWASGEFEADWGSVAPLPGRVEDYPLAEQPHALDRAAMEDCLGGPFHPGCEITWVVRVPHFWKSPFRPNVLAEDAPVQDDFGPVLTPAQALAAEGPLARSGPGSITRWMAVPWHTDTSSCLSGYDASTYLPSPTFWAARVPNQVLSEDAYQRLMQDGLPVGQRLKHFDYRLFWLRDLGTSYQQRINAMVKQWSELGIVEARPGPQDHAQAHLPGRLWVETGRSQEFSEGDWTWKQVLIAEHTEEAPGLKSQEEARDSAQPPAHARRRTYRRDQK
ncbi:LodA/GoxA family CTQ-dependent oxidase, partial [Pyxidicoccus fallax]